MSEQTPRGPLWFLGGPSRGGKMIHVESCRYAKVPYNWANGKTWQEIVAALAVSGAIEWHDACKRCVPELSVAIGLARATRRSLTEISGVGPRG